MGLEAYGVIPEAMRTQVEHEVATAARRAGWPASWTLPALGVGRSSYYRWQRQRAGVQEPGVLNARPLPPPTKILEEERKAIVEYALQYPEIRHRELAWKMVDEDVAYVAPSTVYRVLRQEGLVCQWSPRRKRRREECDKAHYPDQRWSTDLYHLKVGKSTFYCINFMDEYSRYITHHELLMSMDGKSLSLEAQKALDKLHREVASARPEIRSDNGPGYIAKEFREVLAEEGLTHIRIWPYCPEENGLMERCHRTLREGLEGKDLTEFIQAKTVVAPVVDWYNNSRLHSALGYLTPIDYYRGDPQALQEKRRGKIRLAKQKRKQENMQTRNDYLTNQQDEGMA